MEYLACRSNHSPAILLCWYKHVTFSSTYKINKTSSIRRISTVQNVFRMIKPYNCVEYRLIAHLAARNSPTACSKSFLRNNFWIFFMASLLKFDIRIGQTFSQAALIGTKLSSCYHSSYCSIIFNKLLFVYWRLEGRVERYYLWYRAVFHHSRYFWRHIIPKVLDGCYWRR